MTGQPFPSRILIVEPNERALTVMAKRVAEAGYRVVACDKPTSAMAELHRQPADLPDELWFEFYVRYFPAVELDSTFYRTPASDEVRRWAHDTPASFRFTCKLPRAITHAATARRP